MAAYYNEIDPFAAQWLRNLIAEGHIADGVVDERSIADVSPDDLKGFIQCHFFAGIGAWSHALRLAEWPDDRPVWTGSCPCQPFSSAGKGKGVDDERHLWPEFFRLIQVCHPATVFGEQVARKAGLTWLDAVQDDLESQDYAVGSADLSACGVGAPHLRQRLYFVADGSPRLAERQQQPAREEQPTAKRSGEADCGLGHPDGQRLEGERLLLRERGPLEGVPEAGRDGQGDDNSVGNAYSKHEEAIKGSLEGTRSATPRNSSFWDGHEWVLCHDQGGARWRPIEPSTFPLAHGAPARVGRLRGYGNAIVAPLAAQFILAFKETQ